MTIYQREWEQLSEIKAELARTRLVYGNKREFVA